MVSNSASPPPTAARRLSKASPIWSAADFNAPSMIPITCPFDDIHAVDPHRTSGSGQLPRPHVAQGLRHLGGHLLDPFLGIEGEQGGDPLWDRLSGHDPHP